MFQLSQLPRPVIRHLNGLWRRRWAVAAIAFAAALVGWFGLWLLPDKYESRAQVYVQTQTILEPVFNGVTAQPDYAQRVEVMRLQLLTRPNVQEIILRSGLDKTIKTRSPLERRAKMEKLINWVSGQIKIESPREMYFVISYKNSDPEISRAVVDAVLNMLIEQDLGASLSEDEAARRRLNLQIEEYEEKLTANERAVADYRAKHAAELAASQGAARSRELKENELARVQDELERTKGRVITLQNLLSATPKTTSGDELDKLKVQLSELRSKYKESHPDIRGIVARIKQLEQGGGGALSSNPDYVRLQSELTVAQDSIGVLTKRQEGLQNELQAFDIAASQAPAVEAGLQQIIREYQQTQKTYDELLARRDRLELTKNLGAAGRGVEYQVFERPEKALVPVEPPRLLLIIAVFIAAAGAGVGAAMMFTLWDKSYTQSGELQEAFGLPVLGAVSEVATPDVRAERRRDYKRLGGAFAALAVVGVLYAYFTALRLPADPGLEKAAGLAAEESFQ